MVPNSASVLTNDDRDITIHVRDVVLDLCKDKGNPGTTLLYLWRILSVRRSSVSVTLSVADMAWRITKDGNMSASV